jgi:hypothetical protein
MLIFIVRQREDTNDPEAILALQAGRIGLIHKIQTNRQVSGLLGFVFCHVPFVLTERSIIGMASTKKMV